MWRYLNMFVLIGIALVIISIVGFATGNRFLTEPGQPVNQQGSLIYLGAGIIMLVNGALSIRQASQTRSSAPPEQSKQPVGVESKATE
jgi:hypothetical protein